MNTVCRVRWTVVAGILLVIGTGAGFSDTAPWKHEQDHETITQAMELAQYSRREWMTSWLGVRMLQYPTDLMTYQELLYEVKPDVVIETGTYKGGLTLYLATVLDQINDHGKVVTVDLHEDEWLETLSTKPIKSRIKDRIIFIKGNSVEQAVHDRIANLVKGKRVVVILDSDHRMPHVLREIQMYSPYVTKNSYLVVNDTHLDGTKWVDGGPGPMTAIREFLDDNEQFVIDQSKQRFIISCIHSGILRRVK